MFDAFIYFLGATCFACIGVFGPLWLWCKLTEIGTRAPKRRKAVRV